jgi:hypothetical protein
MVMKRNNNFSKLVWLQIKVMPFTHVSIFLRIAESNLSHLFFTFFLLQVIIKLLKTCRTKKAAALTDQYPAICSLLRLMQKTNAEDICPQGFWNPFRDHPGVSSFCLTCFSKQQSLEHNTITFLKL